MSGAGVVMARLEALYAIGGRVGADRPGLSGREEDAHLLVDAWMREAGLETSWDAAGNLYGRLVARQPEAPEIWTGSHLDTVPSGGRFDGALGVVGALEAVRRLGGPLDHTIAVVAFRDEEGWRFGNGCFGSRAVSGQLEPGALDRTDASGVSARSALATLGRDLTVTGEWLVTPPGAFVELHIEQGPVLERAGAALGIVDSIVGTMDVDVRFTGCEGHAGTTPMDARRDAALCAATFQVALAAGARAIPGAVVTVGWLTLEPGASNVIAREARLVVDVRAPDAARLAQLGHAVATLAAEAAETHRCHAEVTTLAHQRAVVCDDAVRRALAEAAPDAPVLPSGAGHDAQVLGAAGVPVGMLFVRSLAGGISHSPREQTSAEDVEHAVDALSRALATLGGRLPASERTAQVGR